jgi:hypothetical protein
VTGRNLGGNALTPEIAQRIQGCDAMIALLTQRAGEPVGTTHPWVLQEFGHARLQGLQAIGVYEVGIPPASSDNGNERIEFAPADPLTAFVRLSEIIGEWKRAAGRLQTFIAMPAEVAESLGAQADEVRCECRFLIEGQDTPWQPAKVRRAEGSVLVVARVPEDVEAVQIRTVAPIIKETPYTPLRPTVNFDR